MNKKVILSISIFSAIFCLVLLAHYLYFCIFVENPKEVTVNGIKYYVSYESRSLGQGSEALATIWKENNAGQRKTIAEFRNVDADNHLGAVTPPVIIFYDCNGDGKKDLFCLNDNVFVDLSTEKFVDITEAKLPYLYQSYIKWHHNWSFSHSKYSYSFIIIITSVVLWFLLLVICYLIERGINYVIQKKRKSSG
jgi:hypothetical protein